jgi:serine O-acetyltransferase
MKDSSFLKMIDDIKKDFAKYRIIGHKTGQAGFLSILVSSPGFWVILTHRVTYYIEQCLEFKGYNSIKYILNAVVFILRYLVAVLFKTEILDTSKIGAGFYMSPKGNCIIGVVSIGNNCFIGENSTVGVGYEGIPPVIGNNVSIGHNSVVFGKINIGNNVIIEPYTVVSKSVPDSCIVSGNPGRIKNS